MVDTPSLAIGPANYAGQGHAWAKAVERTLHVHADSFARGPVRRGEFAFDVDRRIPAPIFFAPLLRHLRMRRFLRPYTHVALDGYQTFFQTPARRDLVADATFLQEAGFRVALIAHGSDIRRPDEHLARLENSYFAEGDEAYVEHHRQLSARNHAAADALGLPLFVSTPDLLADQPSATWLPICLDPREVSAEHPVLERPRPRVLHLPSRRTPPIKGTQYVDPVLRRLHDEGVVEYLSPEGGIPHAEVIAMVEQADIVIDQLLAASYGVAALEALAAGRVVIGHLGDVTRAGMEEAPPIIDATPSTLDEVVRRVVADRDWARERAGAGRPFVEQWHDGRRSAAQLAGFLGLD
ncbi:glycosyltransferase [Aestuariimicrobium soli]|uniref:glycosyltransferase n=1 Tax=Aestuariimicrobium soli TaxID=2035834 RepID=UPI003EBCF36F